MARYFGLLAPLCVIVAALLIPPPVHPTGRSLESISAIAGTGSHGQSLAAGLPPKPFGRDSAHADLRSAIAPAAVVNVDARQPGTPPPTTYGKRDTVLATLPVGSQPAAALYDPETDAFYVPNAGSDNLTVISASNFSTIGSLPAGSGPGTPCLDPLTGALFVPDETSGLVSVVSPSLGSVITSYSRGGTPVTPTFDPASGTMYLPAYNQGNFVVNVSVVNGTNYNVVKTLSLPSLSSASPSSVAFDSGNGELYMAVSSSAYGSNWVETINATTNNWISQITVEQSPGTPVIDSTNGYVYLTTATSGNLTIIDGSNDTVLHSIHVGSVPSDPTIDGTSGVVYVSTFNDSAYYAPGNVSVIDASTGTILKVVQVGSQPLGSLLDTIDGELYVPDNFSHNLSAIALANDSVVATIAVGQRPSGLAIDAATGVIMARLSVSSASIVDGTRLTLTVITVTPSVVRENQTFVVRSEFTGGSGLLTFLYAGLPRGCVSLSAANLTCAPTELGRFVITINVSDASHEWSNASANISVVPSPITLYRVQFNESGLPDGTRWNIALNDGARSNSTNASAPLAVVFQVRNGSYSFVVAVAVGYVSNPKSGLLVVGGGDVYRTIAFALAARGNYSVTFHESGLPQGATWDVTFNGSSHSSTTSDAEFMSILNGTYSYEVSMVPGYNVTPRVGSLTIDGRPVTQNITFSQNSSAPGGQTTGVGSSAVPLFVWVAVALVAVVAVVAALVLWRRAPKSNPEVGSEDVSSDPDVEPGSEAPPHS